MRVALAQISPRSGDVPANVALHVEASARAAAAGAHLVVFPELSLTGYEPRLAANLARPFEGDPRWLPLQHAADRHGITIGAGLPAREAGGGITITHAFFAPGRAPIRYAKQFLHADETPFFVPGAGAACLPLAGAPVAFAICYEIAVPAHTAAALRTGAPLFLASVAKSAVGVNAAHASLPSLAQAHGRAAAMVNAVGPADDFLAAGGSAVWDARGGRLAALAADRPGLLCFDLIADGTRVANVWTDHEALAGSTP